MKEQEWEQVEVLAPDVPLEHGVPPGDAPARQQLVEGGNIRPARVRHPPGQVRGYMSGVHGVK